MLNFALVGCGRIAAKYGEIFSRNHVPDARLVAACDLIPERAAAFEKKHKVKTFPNMHEMMSKGGPIDVVCILTESGNHAKHCLELVKYKKHIIVEKPIALTLDDADAMIQACDEAGIRLFVVKQNRFNLPVQKLREALEQGRFGKLVMGTVRVRWCREQSYYDLDAWRGTWALDGGVFSNQASHHVDLLEWMMGEPESVYATATTRLVKAEAEDTGVAVIKFRSGALGIVEATTAARPTDLEGSISILGEKGTVEVAGFAVNEMKTWRFKEAQEKEADMLAFKENPPNVYGFGHVAYLQHVCQSIQGAKKAGALVDGLEGRKSLELIQAIYESIETGKEVKLRFRAHRSRLGSAGGSANANGAADPGLLGKRPDGLPQSVMVHSLAYVESPQIGEGTRVWAFAHVMKDAIVGAHCNIGEHSFVENGAVVGNGVTIKNGVSLWDEVHIEDDAFVGPHAVFTNHHMPRAFIKEGRSVFLPTEIRKGATLGAGSVVVCGNEVGSYSLVAAGAVVTKPVPAHAIVAGNPAKIAGWLCTCGKTRIRVNEDLKGRTCDSCKFDFRQVATGARS